MRVKEKSEKAGLKLYIQKTKIIASSPITSWEIEGEEWKQWQNYFLGLQNLCGRWLQPWNKKTLEGKLCRPGQCVKKQRHHFTDNDQYIQSYGFCSSIVQVWELDPKEGWAPKNWCFWIVVLEKTLESPLDSKEVKPVNPKENQPWIFIGRTDAEAKAPILWPPDVKNQLIGKDPEGKKDWRQKEKGKAEDEIDSITNVMDMDLSKLQEIVEDR